MQRSPSAASSRWIRNPQGPAKLAQPPNLAAWLRQRHLDRLLVHVHPHINLARLLHGPPPFSVFAPPCQTCGSARQSRNPRATAAAHILMTVTADPAKSPQPPNPLDLSIQKGMKRDITSERTAHDQSDGARSIQPRGARLHHRPRVGARAGSPHRVANRIGARAARRDLQDGRRRPSLIMRLAGFRCRRCSSSPRGD